MNTPKKPPTRERFFWRFMGFVMSYNVSLLLFLDTTDGSLVALAVVVLMTAGVLLDRRKQRKRNPFYEGMVAAEVALARANDPIMDMSTDYTNPETQAYALGWHDVWSDQENQNRIATQARAKE